jgi:hypothetical protein
MAGNLLQHAEEYAQAQEQNQRFNEQMKVEKTAVEATSDVPEADAAHSPAPDEAVPIGPHHFMVGVLKMCTAILRGWI